MTTKKHTTRFYAVSMIALLQTSGALANCPCHAHQSSTALPHCAKPKSEPVETSLNRWGVQAAIVDTGATSIGLVNYGECHSAGLTISGFLRTNGKTSHVFTPNLFGGPRFKIRENTYFGVGVDIGTRLGRQDGQSVNSSVLVGPYASIEYQPARHIVLRAWINPYMYQNESIGGRRTTTHKFATGGLGISYLF